MPKVASQQPPRVSHQRRTANRRQQQRRAASAATAAETTVDQTAPVEPTPTVAPDAVISSAPRSSSTIAARRAARAQASRHALAETPGPRVATMPRDVEYGFIRADLRRMLYTAGLILVIMVALLFVVDR